MKFTKIVATIGPTTSSHKRINSLYKAGMDIARLNGSHNSLEWHENNKNNKKTNSNGSNSSRYTRKK